MNDSRLLMTKNKLPIFTAVLHYRKGETYLKGILRTRYGLTIMPRKNWPVHYFPLQRWFFDVTITRKAFDLSGNMCFLADSVSSSTTSK